MTSPNVKPTKGTSGTVGPTRLRRSEARSPATRSRLRQTTLSMFAPGTLGADQCTPRAGSHTIGT
jgi:hypothetical protein